MNKPGCHRTGLDAHFGVDTSMLRNTSRNWPGIGGADAAPEPLALLVDNADRGRLLRYVQPNIMRHRNLRWCKPPGNLPGSRHYRLLGFEPLLPEVHRCCMDTLTRWKARYFRIYQSPQVPDSTGFLPDPCNKGLQCASMGWQHCPQQPGNPRNVG